MGHFIIEAKMEDFQQVGETYFSTEPTTTKLYETDKDGERFGIRK